MKIVVDITKTYEVIIEINNPDALERMLTEGWQSHFYHFNDRDEALEFLANLAIRGTESVHDLDGWADLKRDDLSMFVNDSSTEDMTIKETPE